MTGFAYRRAAFLDFLRAGLLLAFLAVDFLADFLEDFLDFLFAAIVNLLVS